MPTNQRILITVMTYPHPSDEYQELVCTAGINESNEWVRLYPVDYRYRPHGQQFRKYQWIEVDLERPGSNKDNRPESWRPTLDSIKIHGEPISTKHQWRERREIIDMEIKKQDGEWKPKWQALFSQMRLFGPQQKPLVKLPYSFHYIFECEDSEKPHRAMCEDWELGTLFIGEVERLGSEEAAAKSVRNKFLNELCRDDKDTRFFMGTKFPYNTWLVLGVFWPPKVDQQSLF